MQARSPYIDLLDWEPVRFSVQIADVSDEGLAAYLAQVEARIRSDHAAGRRYALVFDPRYGRPPTLEHRLVQARFIERMAPWVADVNLGVAMCTPSPLLRGLTSALFWVARSPSEQVCLSNMRACLDWAVGKVVSAGLELRAELRERPEAVLAEVADRSRAARF